MKHNATPPPTKTIFTLTIFLLIVAKQAAIVHLDLTDTLYLDVDRTAALLLFLGVYHWRFKGSFDLKYYGLLIGIALMVSALGAWLGVSFWLMLILFLLTAFVEEILLRGVLFELLLRKFSPLAVLLSSSLFFTLIHPAIYKNAIYGVAVLATGLLLGGIYLYFRERGREKAVVYATIGHGLIILLGLKIGLI